MREKFIVWIAAIVVAIMIPYLLTIVINGVVGTGEGQLRKYS